MRNRPNCAKFQENLFRSNDFISIVCSPLFRKRPIPKLLKNRSAKQGERYDLYRKNSMYWDR